MALPLLQGSVEPFVRHIFLGVFIFLLFGEYLKEKWKGRFCFDLLKLRPEDFIFILCLAWSVISCYFIAVDQELAFLRISDFLSFLLCYLLGRLYFRKEEKLRKGVYFLQVLGFGFALHALLQVSGALPHTWWEKADLCSGTYVNHNHFAGLLELLIWPVILPLIRNPRNVGLWLVLVLEISALFLSLSRGAWLSVFLTALLTLILLAFSYRGMKWAIGLFVGSLLIFFVFTLYNSKINQRLFSVLNPQTQHEFLDFRVKLWLSTIEAIQVAPVLGHGPGSFATSMLAYRQPGFEFSFDYAHQDYLQFAMEMGVPAMLGLLFALGLILLRAIRRFYTTTLSLNRFEEMGICLACICLLIHGMVDFNLHIFANACIFSFYLGILNRPIKTALAA